MTLSQSATTENSFILSFRSLIVNAEFELTGGCSIAEKMENVHRGSADSNVVRYSLENERLKTSFVVQCFLVATAKPSRTLYDTRHLCYWVCTRRARPCCGVHLLAGASVELA